MLAFIGRIPAIIRWLAIVALVALVAFFVGRWTGGSSKVTDSTTTSSSSSTSTSSGTSSSQSSTSSTSTASGEEHVVYTNQATIKQDRDTDCTEDFDPTTGKLVRRRCIRKVHTDTTSGSSGGSTSTTTGSTTSGSTTTSTSTATNTSTSTSTATNTTHIAETKGGCVPGFLSAKGLHLSLIGSAGLLNEWKPVAPVLTYGVGISKDLVGPLALGVQVASDKTVIVALDLSLKEWSVSAEAGAYWTDITKPFYGGTLSRRILGPVSVGVWAYTDRSAGLSASITVP